MGATGDLPTRVSALLGKPAVAHDHRQNKVTRRIEWAGAAIIPPYVSTLLKMQILRYVRWYFKIHPNELKSMATCLSTFDSNLVHAA